MPIKTLLCCTAAALILTLVTPADALERGGRMTFVRYDDSTLIDPVYADRNPDIWMVGSLYDTLLRMGSDGKTIVPGLAESWEAQPDGLGLSLVLRDGLAFSDGSPLTSDDVVFSLNRAREYGPWSGLLDAVDAVRADGRTVVLELSRPDPVLLSVLATFNTAIVPEAAFIAAEGGTDEEKARAIFAAGPVGSGPFVMRERRQGTRMLLVRNPHYWRPGDDGEPLPYLDELELLVVPDDATRVLKLQAGEAHGAEFIPLSRVAELQSDPALRMELFPSTRIIYAPINTRAARVDGTVNPLSDVRVRQALNYATNKEALVQLVTFGTGTPATSLMAASTPLHHGPEPLYPYDPDAARKLLAEAGHDRLRITLTTLAGSADDATLFTALQQMWAPIGVTLTVEQVDNPTRGEMNRTGRFEIHTFGWVNDINDPAQITGWLGYYPQRQAVGTGWNDPRFNELFEASSIEIDPEKRAQQYREMQEIYAEAAPLLFLFETPFAVALARNLHGYVQTPLGNNEFAEAWIDR